MRTFGPVNGHEKVPYFPWSLDMLIYAARNRSDCAWTHNGYLYHGVLCGVPKRVMVDPDHMAGRLLVQMQDGRLIRIFIRELENVTVKWQYLDDKWDALVKAFSGVVA